MGCKNKVNKNDSNMNGEHDVILITGGTSGLGLETALVLAKTFNLATIIVASRSGGDCVEQLKEKSGNNKIVFVALDLSSQENIRTFATNIISLYPPLSHLIMNAGIQILNQTLYSTEGIETTFATNHIGHFLLYQLLKNHMTPTARITVTASGTHDPAMKSGLPDAVYRTADEIAHPPENELNGYLRYSSSKLCNVLFTYELARKFRETNSARTVNSMDPGLMPGTQLARGQPALLQWVWHKVFPNIIPLLRLTFSHNVHHISESAYALARLAAFEETANINGKYYEGLTEIRSSLASYDEVKQKDLWEGSVRMTAKNEEEARIFSQC